MDDDRSRQRLIEYARLLEKYMSADDVLIEAADTGRSLERGLFRVRFGIGEKSLIVEFTEADMVDVAGTAVFDSRAILLAMATHGTAVGGEHGDIAFMSLADIRAGYVEE